MKMKNTQKIYRLSLGRRITAALMSFVMMAQICIPGIAAAATLITDDQITSEMMSNYQFQPSSSRDYLYEQAAYFNQTATIQNKTIANFHKDLVTAKAGLPKPTYIPIAGDITVILPVHILGKVIGDAYVQNRYIRSQITDLLGRHMIDTAAYSTELSQINALYANAFTFAKNNTSGYVFGKKIAQAFVISQDMIWPELRAINGQQVLVPIVYLTDNTLNTRGVKDHTIEFAGTSAQFANIILDKTTLLARRNAFIQTMGDIVNAGGTISGQQNLTLAVGGTLKNISGNISADKNLSIIAGQIYNKTQVHPFTDKNGSGTRLGEVAGFDSTNGSISLESYSDIIFEGANATANNGSISFNAANNIVIAGLATQYQGTGKEGDWRINKSSVDIFQSRLNAQETISLIAGGSITISASELTSTKGGIELLAKQGIYVLNEFGQTYVKKEDKKGKTKGTASDFETWAIRSVLNAGKGVLIYTDEGDITLRGTKINSVDGANVTAKNGAVNLLIAKEQSQHYLNTVRKGTWTIKTTTVEQVNETAVPNAIIGGLAVEALHGVNVEYAGIDMDSNPTATLADQIREYEKMPEMAWMATLYKDPNVQAKWAQIELEYKNIRKTKSSLSPAAMAIIAIAMAVAMGPAGAGWIGSNGTIMAAGPIAGPVLSAGATTLATQAATSLASGNNLGETLEQLSSKENLKSLAISMATAGAMSYFQVDKLSLFKEIDSEAFSMASLGNQAYQSVISATISAGISVTINGGNSQDYLASFTQSLAMNAINKVGEHMANKIGLAYRSNDINNVIRYVAHAGAGCILGAASGAVNSGDEELGCLSGAGGAVVGELVADSYKEAQVEALFEDQKAKVEALQAQGKSPEQIVKELTSPAQQEYYNQRVDEIRAAGVDLAKLSGGFAALLANGDVNIAAMTAENAAKNNALFLLPLAVMALKAIDIALTAGDLWKIYIAYQTGGATAGLPLLLAFLGDGATDKLIGVVIPGFKTAEELLEWLRKNDYISDGMLDSVKKVFSENHSKAGTDGNSNFVGVDISNKQVIAVNAGSKGSWDKTINGKLEPNAAYKLDNGHVYVTDSNGRVMNVGGDLDGIKLDRNKHQQLLVGKSENGSGYDGGHLIATQLGGAGDKINLVPMTVGVNRGAYLKMENQLAKDLLDGKNVSVKIDVGYPASNSVTPNVVRVTSYVDGVEKVHTFIQ